MIIRVDRLPVDIPRPKNPNPDAAAAVQELLGGKFGEMSTLMNYTFQSFNFRGRMGLRPFYDLVASIAVNAMLAASQFNLMGVVLFASRKNQNMMPGAGPPAGLFEPPH